MMKISSSAGWKVHWRYSTGSKNSRHWSSHKILIGYIIISSFFQATPLFLTLAIIELSDIVFAVGIGTSYVKYSFLLRLRWIDFHWVSYLQIDSIPAVFGVTRDPFIVFSSNIFAILGKSYLFSVSFIITYLKLLIDHINMLYLMQD